MVYVGASLFWNGPQDASTHEASRLEWQTESEPKSGGQNDGTIASRLGTENACQYSEEQSLESPLQPTSPQHE